MCTHKHVWLRFCNNLLTQIRALFLPDPVFYSEEKEKKIPIMLSSPISLLILNSHKHGGKNSTEQRGLTFGGLDFNSLSQY